MVWRLDQAHSPILTRNKELTLRRFWFLQVIKDLRQCLFLFWRCKSLRFKIRSHVNIRWKCFRAHWYRLRVLIEPSAANVTLDLFHDQSCHKNDCRARKDSQVRAWICFSRDWKRIVKIWSILKHIRLYSLINMIVISKKICLKIWQ